MKLCRREETSVFSAPKGQELSLTVEIRRRQLSPKQTLPTDWPKMSCMYMEYVIDGSRITSLETFYDEISRMVVPGQYWGRNLDAFNDILRGGFGTPEEGFTLKWLNSSHSKEKLGYAETIRQLETVLEHCHPTSRDEVRRKLVNARAEIGPTVFDWLIEIIADHGPTGEQAEDKVRLLLD